MVICYNAIVTSYLLGIMFGQETPKELYYTDAALDFIFAIDMVLHFVFPFVDEDTGDMIIDLKEIRTKHMGSRTFYINAVACIPILKTPLSPFLSGVQRTRKERLFSILRMIRVFNLESQLQEFKQYLSRNDPVNESVFRMGKIMFYTILSMCIFGCMYFGLSLLKISDICPPKDHFDEQFLGVETWVSGDFVITDVMDQEICSSKPEITCNECPKHLFFVRPIYFLMQTLFTIGYGDSVVPSKSPVEMFVACIFMLGGVFVYGLIIANMTSVLANLDVVSMRFRQEMDSMSRWMSLRSMPKTLRDQINVLFTYLNRNQYGMLEDTLFSDLPPRLSLEVAACNMELLTKVPYFNPVLRSEIFLTRIVNSLVLRVYPPNSCILYEKEMQRELIIIKSGRADMFIAGEGGDEAVGNLTSGDFIGDYQLLFGTINQVGLRSVDITEALVLTLEKFEQVLDHPDHCKLSLKAAGGNFRLSNDEGAQHTIATTRESLRKISIAVSNIKKKQHSRKLKDMMEKPEVVVKGNFIYPNSKIHVFRDIVALLAIMYYAISASIRFAAYCRSSTLRQAFDIYSSLDFFFDVLFFVDMMMQVNIYAYVSYDSGQREVIMDRQLMKRNYIESQNFKIDLLSVIPFDLATFFTGYFTLWRTPKLFRVLQIPNIVSRLQRNLDECMQITLPVTKVSSLIMLLFSVLIVVWGSAGWYAVRDDETVHNSVYWAFTTLATVGYGDLTPENFRQTCYVLVAGALMSTFTAAIVATVTSFYHAVDASEDSISHRFTAVKWFLERHNSSLNDIKKLVDYFDYIESEQLGLNEHQLMNYGVPDNIKENIMNHLTHSMVMNCDFFTNCGSAFLRRVVLSLQHRFFCTHVFVIDARVPADGVYFVKKGVVELMKQQADESLKVDERVLVDGYFAEGSLLERWDKNPFLARAATNCELWFLSRSKFNDIVGDFPNVRSIVRSNAKQKWTRRRPSSIQMNSKVVDKSKVQDAAFIHPDGHFIQIWLGLVLVIVLYNYISLIFRVAFMENHEVVFIWMIFDYVGDTVLAVDVILRARFLAYYDDNHLITRRDRIWHHYVQSGKMKWHIVAILPLELATIFVQARCPLWTLQVYSLFRCTKLSRMLEVPYLLNRVELSLFKAGVKVPKNFLKVGKQMMLILLMTHLYACVWWGLANFNQHAHAGDPLNQSNWANTAGLLSVSPQCPGKPVDFWSMSQQYIYSIYWATATFTTVGYGDVTANKDSVVEKSFAMLAILLGVAVYIVFFVTSMEEVVAQLDVTSSLFQEKTNKVDLYMQAQGMPDSLKTKINSYYDYVWRAHKGVKGTTLLRYMPQYFRVDIQQKMLCHLLDQTYFINDCKADFVTDLIATISLELYLPNDTVFVEGETCDTLHFLYSGKVDLFTSKEVKFKTVSGCVLGESSFFGFEPYLCTAKSADTCEIFSLDLKEFLNQLKEHDMGKAYAEFLENNQEPLSKAKASTTKMIQNLASSKMAKMLDAEVKEPIPKGVILPNTRFREAWDLVALVFVLCFVIWIPHQISFSDGGVHVVEFALDTIMDTFFIADMYLRLFHFATLKDGFLISSPTEFRKLYMKTELYGDAVSLFPVSLVGYIAGASRRTYGAMRLLQLFRSQRVGKYFNSLVETVQTRTKVFLSTANLRILNMLFFVLVLCHAAACVFHFIGATETSGASWIQTEQLEEATMDVRYLHAIYWAFYTVTTVGYGSISVISLKEKILAIISMLAGSVVCDAGVTAVLSDNRSKIDSQAATNRRRIQCSKKFMASNFIPGDLQERVLDFYNYADTELRNVDEGKILSDFSVALKREVLRHFCYPSFRQCSAFSEFSDGSIVSLTNALKPYTAIPGERLSEIGKECPFIYILQRGRLSVIDYCGQKENAAEGAVIGHAITKATWQNDGSPTRQLRIDLISLDGMKATHIWPYIVITCGTKSYRSTLRKTKRWKDTLCMKLSGKVNVVQLNVRVWQKHQAPKTLGSTKVDISSVSGEVCMHDLLDEHGKKMGRIKFNLSLANLEEDHTQRTHELTALAKGYCHLYRIEAHEVESLRQYLARSKLSSIISRIPLSIDYKEKRTRNIHMDPIAMERYERTPSTGGHDLQDKKHESLKGKDQRKALKRSLWRRSLIQKGRLASILPVLSPEPEATVEEDKSKTHPILPLQDIEEGLDKKSAQTKHELNEVATKEKPENEVVLGRAIVDWDYPVRI